MNTSIDKKIPLDGGMRYVDGDTILKHPLSIAS